MKIILTGSLGHIGKPLTQELVQKGHQVTVISSNPDKQKDIETLGAVAAIGSLEDADFLAKTYTGADVAYCMVPPANYFDQNLDLLAYYHKLGNNYRQAIEQSGVKRVVNLSTIGGNMERGNGILLGAHDVEEILNKLPTDVSVTHVRPTSIFYNLYGYTDSIKNQNVIAANYGAEDIVPWVSPIDIAAVVAEEITAPLAGGKVRYVASDERTCTDTARVLGAAIGKPDLKWIIVSDEQMQSGLETAGMNPKIAAGLVEMYAGFHSGLLSEDYNRHKPKVLGKVKLEDFAKEFAHAFKQE